jgi:hypothetical protein
MTVETVLRRIERQCREDAKAFATYKPIVDGRERHMPGASGEARGSVQTFNEIQILCKRLRRECRKGAK